MSETTVQRCLEAWNACIAALIEVGRLPDPAKKKATPKAKPAARGATETTATSAEAVETTPATLPYRTRRPVIGPGREIRGFFVGLGGVDASEHPRGRGPWAVAGEVASTRGRVRGGGRRPPVGAGKRSIR